MKGQMADDREQEFQASRAPDGRAPVYCAVEKGPRTEADPPINTSGTNTASKARISLSIDCYPVTASMQSH